MKILAPNYWGTGHLSYAATLAVWSNPGLEKEVLGRATVDKEIRMKLERMGILEIMESPRHPDLDNNEFTILGLHNVKDFEMEDVGCAQGIKWPQTYLLKEFQEKPFFPVVMKGNSHGGRSKYLLETQEQFDIFLEFLYTEGSQLKDYYTFQEFIDTPSDRFTSYRILTTATGRIIAAGLFYSRESKNKAVLNVNNIPEEDLGVAGSSLEDYLTSINSPYCLYSRRFTSNLNTGGGCISLGTVQGSKPTAKHKEILIAHGISDDKPHIPENLIEASSKIGRTYGRRLGLVSGQDFLQSSNGDFYYLESNAGPSLTLYINAKKQGQGTQVDAYRMLMNEVIDELQT